MSYNKIVHAKFFFCSSEEAEGIKKYVEALKPVLEEDTHVNICEYFENYSGMLVEYSQWGRDDLLLDPLMRHYPAFTYYTSEGEEWTDDVEHFVFPMFRTAGDWCYSMEDLYESLAENDGITNIEKYNPPKDPKEFVEWLDEGGDGEFDEDQLNGVFYVEDSPSPDWYYQDEYQPLIEKLRQTKKH